MQGATTVYAYSPANQSSMQNRLESTGLLNNIVGGGPDVVISATVVNVPLAQGFLDRNVSGFLVQGSANVPEVPEPSTLAMMGLGATVLAVAQFRRK